MKAKRNAQTKAEATAPEPDVISFTKEDLGRLDEIFSFMLALHATFNIGEIGHNTDMQAVADLTAPAYQRLSEFRGELQGRFDDQWLSRKAGA